MNVDTVTSLLVGIAVLVGCLGIIVPVLPGSILIAVAVLIWAFVIGTPAAWIVFAIVAVLVAGGMSASFVLTGRKLKEMEVPNRSVAVAGVLAIVGFFVIPVLGLPLGFVLGLYLAEYARLKTRRPRGPRAGDRSRRSDSARSSSSSSPCSPQSPSASDCSSTSSEPHVAVRTARATPHLDSRRVTWHLESHGTPVTVSRTPSGISEVWLRSPHL